MNAGQLTNAIIALATLITAVTGLVAVFKKVENKVTQLNGKIDEVSTAVNGKNDSLLSRTAQLETELQNNQIAIPPDPNVKVGV